MSTAYKIKVKLDLQLQFQVEWDKANAYNKHSVASS